MPLSVAVKWTSLCRYGRHARHSTDFISAAGQIMVPAPKGRRRTNSAGEAASLLRSIMKRNSLLLVALKRTQTGLFFGSCAHCLRLTWRKMVELALCMACLLSPTVSGCYPCEQFSTVEIQLIPALSMRNFASRY
jgi:hypothetical protein